MWSKNSKELSRRRFLGNSAASGAAFIGAGIVGSAAFADQTPKKGGTLRIGVGHGSTTETLNPAHLESGAQELLTRAFSDNLTEIVADGSVQPSLAESWEASPDAKEWTFRLRKGVEFHNGKILDADDVIASINYHRSEGTTSSVAPLAKPIVDIIKLDELTVKFVLESGSADFPLTMDTAGFMILPAGPDGNIVWKDSIGTGGYKLESYKPGISASLVRNENDWNPNRAHFDRIEVLNLVDPTARSSALVGGIVDVIDRVIPKTASLLGRQPGVKVIETAGPLHYTFSMLTDQAPFDDINVRQALKFAINREELLDKLLYGHGTIGNDSPIGPSYRYFADDLEKNTYDPDKSKFHLKKAGLTDLTVNLSAADAAFPGAVDAAVLYKAWAADAGININVVREVNDGYWTDVWLKKPFCAVYWAGYASEDIMFTTGYSPGSSWNDTNWDDERFNKLMAQARGELDENLRRELYREMQIILRDEGGAIVPLFANDIMAKNEKVQHGALSSQGSLDGRRICERWWKA